VRVSFAPSDLQGEREGEKIPVLHARASPGDETEGPLIRSSSCTGTMVERDGMGDGGNFPPSSPLLMKRKQTPAIRALACHRQ